MKGIQLIIPCRGFATGKRRLAPHLEGAARRRLNEWFLTRTLDAALAAGVPRAGIVVVSPDAEVHAAVRARGLAGVTEPEDIGLNAALALARAAAPRTARTTVVLPVDLPFVECEVLAALLERADAARGSGDVLLAPDRAGTGTNALACPARVPFEFAFGPRSLAFHYAEAARHGFGVERFTAPALAFDVDVAGDLEQWAADARFPEALRALRLSRASE